MKDIRETVITHVEGDAHASFYSCERKWINRVVKLSKQNPESVIIQHINKDGSIVAHVPADWVKVSIKRKRKMTDEERKAAGERLAASLGRV